MKIYVDGHELYIAYVNETTGEEKVEYTGNRVPFSNPRRDIYEYEAIYEALNVVKDGETVEIVSDCQTAVMVLSKGPTSWGSAKPHRKLIRRVRQAIWRLIKSKKLKVQFSWVPREKNLAGYLIDQKMGKQLTHVQ